MVVTALQKKAHGRRLTRDERRSKIVSSAERLFSEKGFRGTTTREIASKAGISEAMIFKHFKGKRALYKAIIEQSTNDASGNFVLSALLKKHKGPDMLSSVADYLVRRYADDPDFARLLMYSALEGGELSDIFMKSRGLKILSALSSELKSMQKAGTIKDVDTELAARAFMGMVLHYSMMQEIYGFKKFFHRPHAEVVDTFVDVFLYGVRKGRGK